MACKFDIFAHCPMYTIEIVNSLLTVDTFSWLSVQEVTLRTTVLEVSGSILGSDKDFVGFFVLLLLFFIKNWSIIH